MITDLNSCLAKGNSSEFTVITSLLYNADLPLIICHSLHLFHSSQKTASVWISLPHVEMKQCFQHHFPINSTKHIRFTFTFKPLPYSTESEVSQENEITNYHSISQSKILLNRSLIC